MVLFHLTLKQIAEKNQTSPLPIGVVDRRSGLWISGRSAYHVVGSKKVFGPMGDEDLPFNALSEADVFTGEHEDRAMLFDDITI